MKILLINHYAGSIYHGMEFRPYYLSKEWVKMGHEVVIVAASFSHLRQKNVDISTEVREENIDGVRYLWLKTPEYNGNGLGRIRNMLAFIRKLYVHLPKITADFIPDAVIASSTYPLDSYPAKWIAKKHGAKFVFELHDLWPMSPQVLGNMSKWHPFIMVMQMAEDYWCRNADVVISLLPDAYKHLVTRGMKMRKYRVVPNGIATTEWENCCFSSDIIPAIRKIKSDGSILVGYLGGHAISNGLDFVIDSACKLRKRKIKFVIVGNGTEKARLMERVEKERLSDVVYFFPAVPKKFVPSVLSEMDILTLVAVDSPLYEFGVSPNKIYDYMMAAKPILWSANVSNNIIRDAECGYTTSPGDIEEYLCMLNYLISLADKDRETIGKKGRDFVLDNYTYDKLARIFLELIK